MFNFGVGELVVLVSLGIIFFGPKRLPDVFEDLRERMIGSPRWSWSDWVRVGAALVSAAVALALLAGPSP